MARRDFDFAREYGEDGALLRKRCTCCEVVQDIGRFSPDDTRSDGYYGQCRTCRQHRDEARVVRRHGRPDDLSRWQCLHHVWPMLDQEGAAWRG